MKGLEIVFKQAEEVTVYLIFIDIWNDFSKIPKKNINNVITETVIKGDEFALKSTKEIILKEK